MQKRNIVYVFTAKVALDFLNKLGVDQLVLKVVNPNSFHVEELQYQFAGYQALVLLPRLDQHMLLLTCGIFVPIFRIIINENDLHEVPQIDILIPCSNFAHPIQEVVPFDLRVGDILDQHSLF